LPAPGRDPFFEHRHPVPAPKAFALNHEERGSENASLNRGLAQGAGMVFDICGFKTGTYSCGLEAEALRECSDSVRIARVQIAGIVSAEHFLCETLLVPRMIGLNPVKSARRWQGDLRMVRWGSEWDPHLSRGTRPVMPCIVAFDRG